MVVHVRGGAWPTEGSQHMPNWHSFRPHPEPASPSLPPPSSRRRGPLRGPKTCRTGIPSGHIRSQEWSPMLTQTDEVLAGTLLESSPTKEAVFSWAAALRNAGAQSALNAVNRSPTFQPNGLCQRGHLTHRGVLCSPMGFAAEGAWPTRGTFKPIMGFATEGA